MTGNPIGTMVGNNLGRAGGSDTSYRDMVGDNLGGAMGTMIGNGQGLASNMASEYNANNLTDIQKNMMAIDAAGAMGGSAMDSAIHGGAGSTPMDSAMTGGMNMGGSAMSNAMSGGMSMGNSAMSSAMSGGMNMGSQMSAHAMGMGANGGMVTGALVAGGAGMAAGMMGNGERQSFVNVQKKAPAAQKIIIKEGSSKSFINLSLKKNEQRAPSSVAKGPTPGGISSGAAATGEEEEEERLAKAKALKKKSESPDGELSKRSLMRPTEWNETEGKRKKPVSREALAMAKLKSLSAADFESLVKKTAGEFQKSEGPAKAIAHCKMRKLQIEAERRMG